MKNLDFLSKQKIFLKVLFLSLLFILVTKTFAQISWTKYGAPVLEPGQSGEWDDGGVAGQTVIYENGIYKMWYGGSDGSIFRILYAYSSDGITWIKHNEPVLDVGNSGEWDRTLVYFPWVAKVDTIYHMWYDGGNGNLELVGHATSLDGLTWTKDPANPVIKVGTPGKWDDAFVAPGPVTFDGNTFKMLYSGYDGTYYRGGYATSTDGSTWTKSADPILDVGVSGSWDTPRINPCSVVYNPNTSLYYLFYAGGAFADWRIGYATSSSLEGPWTKNSSILVDVTPGSWDNAFVSFPCVIYDSTSNNYKMWYMGGSTIAGAIGYATSELFSDDTLSVPTDYLTIQGAINAAHNGDVVLVDEGTYYENINFRGKAITVTSRFLIDADTSHISKTIIDGSQPVYPDSGSVVTFNSGEDTNSVLCGFTITGGTGTIDYNDFYGTYDKGGGGIKAFSGCRISHNIITGNEITRTTLSHAFGGGIQCGGNTIIEYNNINNNTITCAISQAGAGGVFITGSGTRLVNNSITDNVATSNAVNWNANGGGIVVVFSEVFISGNIIARNKALAPNCSDFPCYGGGFHLFATDEFLQFYNNKVIDNFAQGKSGSSGGGINLSGGSNQIFRNNIIVRNTATEGAGISCRLSIAGSGPPRLINNTIAFNKSTNGQGGGIFSTGGWTTVVLNCIVWGNTAPSNDQVSGLSDINYSNIQGGYSETSNINENPDFADTINYYLNSGSPCVDAGNPDTSFNDIEDPGNPGYALYPALGTIRNDMGAYGGYPVEEIRFINELKGPQFKAFVDRVNSALNSDKQAIIDSFMNSGISFPFIENNSIVYYIYQGTVNSINVPGDANNWLTEAYPMTKLPGTNFWFYEAEYESDARLDYKFYIDRTTWILDPLNPHTVAGGYGPNSELAMPDYVQPPEIEDNANISHGEIETFPFTSTILNNTRTIKVYLPVNYESQLSDSFRVVLFHDGLDYLTLANAKNTLDYLINSQKIHPVIGVFVPPIDRDNEYAFTKTQLFESFIIDELMPHIDSTYRTMQDPQMRAMIGLSYGGLISTQICYNNPDQFGLCGLYSPSYSPNNKAVYNSVINGAVKDIKWYIDWGSYEPDIMSDAQQFKDELLNKGYNLNWNEWHEAHSWGNWRAHLDNSLEFLLIVGVEPTGNTPIIYSLSQNYPNPFNPTTKIKYSVPKLSQVQIKVFDILGKEIKTLVNEEKLMGNYEVEFTGRRLASGIYFYQLKAGDFVETKKMLLIK